MTAQGLLWMSLLGLGTSLPNQPTEHEHAELMTSRVPWKTMNGLPTVVIGHRGGFQEQDQAQADHGEGYPFIGNFHGGMMV